jgi:hydroxyacylglutathione hydrolase
MKTITPSEAAEILKTRPDVAFIDVRSRAEYVAGHPKGAANVPLLEPDASGRMAQNPDFVRAVCAYVTKDRALIVSCQAGGRSARAAEILEREGYREVYNMDGGFGGRRDALGQAALPGWEATGLPVDYDEGGLLGYEHIRRMADFDDK